MLCKVVSISSEILKSKKNENYKFKVFQVIKRAGARDYVVGDFVTQSIFVSEQDLHFFKDVEPLDVIDIHYESDGRFTNISDVTFSDEELF